MKDQNDLFKDSISNDFHQAIPSKDFTDTVMANIQKSLETKAVYEPLISKKWWKIIGSIAFSIITFSFIFESQYTMPNFILDISIPSFENYKTSIQLTILILIMLIVMTLTDLIYRKYKHIN